MNLLKLQNVGKLYREKEEINGFLDVSFSVQRGDSIAVMGESDTAKSTLLNVLGLLEGPASGDYYIQEKNVADYADREKAIYRNRFFGFVRRDAGLVPYYTVEQNVKLPLEYTLYLKGEKRERIEYALERFRLTDKRKVYPEQLSDGEKWRVAIARALINDPKVFLCDEPTGAMDEKTSVEIVEILRELNRNGETMIIATSDSRVEECCKRKIWLEKCTKPEEISHKIYEKFL